MAAGHVPELGLLSLLLAAGLACLLTVVPTAGVATGRRLWMASGPFLAGGVWVFAGLAFLILVMAFLGDDFSVRYVADHSNSALPWYYKVSAVWGAHEGSFLLWVLVAASWTLLVGACSAALDEVFRARVMAVLGALLTGFLLFLLLTSNPFERTLPVFPADGADLNPLLQDFGLIVHPPMLYVGYVGFSVPFAFAVASLWGGQVDAAWARWSRPWTNAAWAFLSVGIVLGSWWAYYELGWGGWWFWDPVENASFMPWLIGTALIHSLAVTEKRGVFRGWTLLLAIFAFSFSLLGAFLVRSGVLTSVHAFAVDPQRGLFLLLLLGLVVGGSLLLYALRAGRVAASGSFGFTGRETLLLVNNVVLVTAAAAVLLGTLAPLVYEAMSGGGKISVGPPYFNIVFVPLALLLLVFMAVSPGSRWRGTPLRRLLYGQRVVLPLAVVAGVAWSWAAGRAVDRTVDGWSMSAVVLAVWVLVTLAVDGYRQAANKRSMMLFAGLFAGLSGRSPSWYGMVLGHGGIAVAVIGVALTSYYSVEQDVLMRPGERVAVGRYEVALVDFSRVTGPNHVADQANMVVYRGGREVARLAPQKRLYDVSRQVMTEADMDAGLFRDIYVAMGERVDDGAWAMRVQMKPYVRWIWLGGLLVAAGGLVTLLDRRYRMSGRAARRSAAVVRAGSAGPTEQAGSAGQAGPTEQTGVAT